MSRKDPSIQGETTPLALELTASGAALETSSPKLKRMGPLSLDLSLSGGSARGLAYIVAPRGPQDHELRDVLRRCGYRSRIWSGGDELKLGLSQEVPDLAVIDARRLRSRLAGLIEALDGQGCQPEKIHVILPPESPRSRVRALYDCGVRGVVDGGRALPGLEAQLVSRGLSVGAPSSMPDAARRSWVDTSKLDRGLCVSDRFIIGNTLGEGMWSVVYEARDTELDDTVAIKFFRPSTTQSDAALRFRREARLCRRLSHPNLARVYEFGTWDGLMYLTMERLHGRTLAEWLSERRGPVPLRQALRMVADAAAGLSEAHRNGVVHRDIKPSNLFLEDRGSTRVLDFGFARGAEGDMMRSDLHRVVGTPAYIAPEQISGGGGDGSAGDFFALGAVLYQLCTGALPFCRKTVQATLAALLNEEAPAPRLLRADLPPELDALILSLLEKDPSRRLTDWRKLRKALVRTDRVLARTSPGARMPTRPGMIVPRRG